MSYSLAEFNESAQDLLEPDKNPKFTRFVLTGEADDHQAVIDPNRNALPPADDLEISLERDYDSVLGISNHIRVKTPISISVYPDPTKFLCSSMHIRHQLDPTNVSIPMYLPVCVSRIE